MTLSFTPYPGCLKIKTTDALLFVHYFQLIWLWQAWIHLNLPPRNSAQNSQLFQTQLPLAQGIRLCNQGLRQIAFYGSTFSITPLTFGQPRVRG